MSGSLSPPGIIYIQNTTIPKGREDHLGVLIQIHLHKNIVIL
jgi:hypothetical protein